MIFLAAILILGASGSATRSLEYTAGEMPSIMSGISDDIRAIGRLRR